MNVTDHIHHAAEVTAAQALAYVRRVLPGWTERRRGPWAVFVSPISDEQIRVPLADHWGDYSRRVTEVIGELVDRGVAAQPSDVLRAMAAEVPS